MAFGIIRRIKIFQINVIISTDFSQQIYVNLPFWGSLNDLELPEFIILNFLKKKFLIHKIFNWVQGIRMCLMIIFQLTTHCFVTRAVYWYLSFLKFPISGVYRRRRTDFNSHCGCSSKWPWKSRQTFIVKL